MKPITYNLNNSAYASVLLNKFSLQEDMISTTNWQENSTNKTKHIAYENLINEGRKVHSAENTFENPGPSKTARLDPVMSEQSQSEINPRLQLLSNGQRDIFDNRSQNHPRIKQR